MPFAYDKIRKSLIQFHKDQPLPEEIEKLISSLHSISNKNAENNLIFNAKTKVVGIRTSIYSYLYSHTNPAIMKNSKKQLKNKGLVHTMRLAEFCRYWDPSRICELKPDYSKLVMFTNLIHTVDEKKMASLAGEVSYYMEFAKEEFSLQQVSLSIRLNNFSSLINMAFRVFTHQPSNCCSERLNSVFRTLDFHKNALESTIEASTVCRFNHMH